MTYNQWFESKTLLYAPDWMGMIQDRTSYFQFYEGYTINKFPTEIGFYGTRTEHFGMTGITIEDVYEGFSVSGFFTPDYFGDIWIGYD